MNRSQIGIEEYAEASAAVVSKVISAVFRILYAIAYGIFRGLCLLPIIRGIRKAIVFELENRSQ